MELKTKYQYTYFIHPYVVKEKKYQKYMLQLLKNKKCKLRIFQKDKDLDIYTYFIPRIRNYLFNTFNFSKQKIRKFEELSIETKAAILAKYPCTIFEYEIEKDIQGKTYDKNSIFFRIQKIEFICFNTGICFLSIKTNVEESDNFSDVLNFNYKFRDINEEFGNLKNYDNIKVQTDKYDNIEELTGWIRQMTGSNVDAIKLEIDPERFLTYSYVCIDQQHWGPNQDLDNIKHDYMRYSNILPSDNSIDYLKQDMKTVSRWKYAVLTLNKLGTTLFTSNSDINNYTKLPLEYENQYFYTYILALYTKIYLRKINLEFKQGNQIKNTRKKFIEFTKNLWIQEVTLDDIGTEIYHRIKEVLELEETYEETKNKYDVMYKELNIEKNARSTTIIAIILGITLIFNIVNFFVLSNQ